MIEASKDYNPLSPIDWHQAMCILEHMEKAGILPPRTAFEIAGQPFSDNFWEQE
jgi:hypothetical protein